MQESLEPFVYIFYVSTTMKIASRKIQRTRLSDQVVDRLVHMVASGKLQPGEKLPPEPRLMEMFGVGRSSIREAIGALELLGLLKVRPGDGTRLTDAADMIQSRAVGLSLINIGQEAINDLVEARVDLELSIVAHAARRATAEDIAAMKREHARLQRPTCTGRSLISADIGFHTAIAKASHNSVLFRFFSELRQPVRNWMEQKYRHDWGRDQVVEDHEAILLAIEARDEPAAQAAMRRHVQRAGEKLVAAMLEPAEEE